MSDFGPFERHEMPNGTEVFYRDSDHAYYQGAQEKKNGEWSGKGRLTGVSTVVAPYDFRPDRLLNWAARTNGEGVAILAAEGLSQEDPDDMRTALAWLSSADAIWQALTNAELTFNHLRDARAAEGTNVHEHALRALATGRPVPDLSALTPAERGYARGVIAFWHEREPVPTHSEQVVADLDLGVAGRFDLRCDLLWQGERVHAIVDCKTSGFIPTKHHAQLAGYEHCAVRSGFDPTDIRLILQVDAKGGYELIEAQASAPDFIIAVELYRRAAQISNRDRGAWKERQAALEAAA